MIHSETRVSYTNSTVAANSTTNDTWIEVGSPEHREIWMSRLREVRLAQYHFIHIYFETAYFYLHYLNLHTFNLKK